MNIITYALSGILLLSFIVNGIQRYLLIDMTQQRDKLALEVDRSNVTNELLKGSIEDRNKIIISQKIDLNVSLDKLEKWRSKKPEVKYDIIYKTIPATTDLKETSCETTKSAIDSIRSINFNDIN